MENYQRLVERISKLSALPVEEIERKIEGKRAKLSGLISKEGAAQIVAAELGISLEGEQLKLAELVNGMKRVHVIGQITKIFPIREYSKNDKSGKVASFLLGDESSNTRVVLWDMVHIGLLENNEIKEGDVIEINQGSVRNGELHLSGFSDMKKVKETITNVQTERAYPMGKIKDAQAGATQKVRAVIIQMFDPRYFEAKNTGQKRAVVSAVIDDGTETIRAVFFWDQIKMLGFTDEEILAPELFRPKKDALIGDEKVFIGNFKMNNYFNNLEMAIDNIESVDVDALIKELEAKV